MEALELIRTIALLTKDGEPDEGNEGRPWEMPCDDAVDTLNRLIEDAREIMAFEEKVEAEDPEMEVVEKALSFSMDFSVSARDLACHWMICESANPDWFRGNTPAVIVGISDCQDDEIIYQRARISLFQAATNHAKDWARKNKLEAYVLAMAARYRERFDIT